MVILRFAIKRLSFVNPAIKTFITDICFFLIVFLIAWLLWRLINLVAQQADAQARKTGHQKEAESLITLMVWGLRMLVVILVLVMILIHYGINVTGFTFILGVIAFALSLAGRDILTDIISGAMILIDQPFRIGDRLDLPSLNSWGDVVDIGMRSTKILSVENRMVVIPNSLISNNQVVNYSYPDPSYFNTIDVFVAYDNDPDQVAEIIVKAIRSVEGVQLDRDVLAWLHEFNQYYMSYWACWWVAAYTDRYPVQDRVSRAIIRALKDAGVVLPYEKGRLNVRVDPHQPGFTAPSDDTSITPQP
jgi:small-conductance mechanosensitive channel